MQRTKPLVLTLCDDLFFLPRIEDAAIALGFRFKAISNKEDIGVKGNSVRREIHLTEPLDGPEAILIRYLTDEQPALMIVDTANQSIPWRNWIHVIKTSAATRRIPIIAFGPHVDQDALTNASNAGADLTVSRGRLQSTLDELITKWALIPDQDAINSACGEGLSDEARHGIQLIADGRFYDAHEILEKAWLNSVGAERYLLRSLLQVSVTYLQIKRDNLRGAMKMLLRVKQWLGPLPPECRGIDVDALRGNLSELRTALDVHYLEGSGDSFDEFLRPIPTIVGNV